MKSHPAPVPLAPYFLRFWCQDGVMLLLYDVKAPHKLLFATVHGWN